jgi:hypothetical protein
VCTFNFDGTAPTGCIGNDKCSPIGETTDPTTNMVTGGLGYCQGGCQQPSDCSALGTGWTCQVDLGFCTQKVKARTLAIGSACASTSTACNCLADTTTHEGFCTSACIVGGVPCPDGWMCDDEESNVLMDGTVLAAENVQTNGSCFPACLLGDAGVPEAAAPGSPVDGSAEGAAGDASGGGAADAGAAPLATCPANSVCQVQSPLGPECTP